MRDNGKLLLQTNLFFHDARSANSNTLSPLRALKEGVARFFGAPGEGKIAFGNALLTARQP
jgi:hypothetical protein